MKACSSMPTRAILLALAFLIPAEPGLLAQTPAGTLTLEEAIALARRNNPAFLQQQNDAGLAEWQTREAYGGLLPSSSVSGGLSYQASGEQRFGAFSGSDLGIGETPAYYFSDYSLGMRYDLSGSTLYGVKQARSSERAVDARISAAAFNLSAAVTRQYLAVLRAQDGVVLAEQEHDRATENYKLAEARVSVGAAIPLDEKQAAVELGRAEVAVLQAQNQLVVERLRLGEQIGTEIGEGVELVSRFTVGDPPASKEALLERAIAQHPNLTAYRASEQAARAGVRMAQSSYMPSLSLTAGWSGYTRAASNDQFLIDQAREGMESALDQCNATNEVLRRLTEPLPTRDCSGLVFTPDIAEGIRRENNAFPFDFTSQPFGASLSVSLPLFTGFSRQRQVEQAKVAASDASHQRRAEEMRLKTEVESAYSTLVTARRSESLEARNRELADEQLNLARERYRVGAANFLELKDAETLKARADRDYLTALYSYHEALAALQAAVGEPLTLSN